MSGIPLELIREVQISTRAAAGLSNYNPSDPNLPELPPLSAVIADSDPSPPHLRCKNCNGSLLRGSESIVCVYCGCGPHYDAVPHPIGFTSTIGYQWLLRSLRLDGSEKVDRPNKSEQDQSQSSPKAAPSLSGLLNFTVPWPAETDKEEKSLPDKHSEGSKRSFSLTGVPPDKFFIKSNRNILSESSLEQPVLDNVIGTADRKDDDNQNLFQNVRSSESTGSSSKQKTGDAFSGWQADFQFADSENQQGGHKSSADPGNKVQDYESFEAFQFADSEIKHGGRASSEHFVGSSAESGNKFQESESFEAFQFADSENKLGGHESSEHFVGSSAEPGNKFQDSESFEDFQFANSGNKHGGRESHEHFVGSSADSGNKFQDSELFEDFQFADSENRHGSRESSEHFAGSSAEPGNKHQDPELFEDFQFADTENKQGSSKSSEPGNKFQGSNFFEDFQFADSKNQPGGRKSSEHFAGSSTEPGNKSQECELFEDFQFADSEDQHSGHKSAEYFVGSSSEPDLAAHIDSVFGPGQDFTDAKPKDNATVAPAFDTWNSDDLWNNLTSNKSNFAATVSTKDDSKGDHTLEYSKKDLSTNDDLFQDFQSQSNYPHKPENKAVNEEHKTEDEDSFEDWNDFTGSTSLNDYQVSTSDQNLLGTDFFSSDKKFEGVSRQNFFSTSTSNSIVLPEANTIMPENHAQNWLSDASGPSQESGQALKNEDSSGKSTKEDDVKKLILEMHDLSFMLKTDLSVPPASETPKSPPKD